MDPTELAQELDSFGALEQVNRWLARGDGIAVYENVDLGHPEVGHRKYVSYGGPDAQLETDEPPQKLSDIGAQINWRYHLRDSYRGEELSAVVKGSI